jgi:2-amino-4-hydroxy-6-hydroxymethyldihydropteridine diphosphokinase
MVTVFLGLGSNLGDRQQNLAHALEMISHKAKIERVSAIYETESVGFKEQPLFLNAVCRIATRLSSRNLLSFVKEIEVASGRIISFPNAPRILDIDILFYGNEIMDSQDLTIPHPLLTQRAFVLIPMAEIAPKLIHPKTGKTISELLSSLENTDGVLIWAEAEKTVLSKRRRHVPGIR